MWLKRIRESLSLRVLDAFIAAAIFTLLASYGFLDDMDARASDWLYQSIDDKNSDIVVIGIDAATFDKLGPLCNWSRKRLADAIEILNRNESHPAAIGIDLLITGNKQYDIEGDRLLVDVVKKYNNVIVGSAVIVDETVKNMDNSPNFPWNLPWPWDRPYKELSEVALTGHIISPGENVARHAILYVDTLERGRIYSFPRVIYEKWCESKNIAINPLPQNTDSLMFYIPFTAKNYSSGYNFLDLLEGKVPPEVYKDKIVLIGICAPGMSEAFATALDRDYLMYGIDIHANIIRAFQNNFIPYSASERYQLIILFVICFITEFFFRRAKLPYAAALWLTVSVIWLITAQMAYKNGIVIHALWIPFSIAILFIGSIASNYMIAHSERELVYRVFGRYVDPVVMEELLKDGIESFDLRGKPQNIAVLFVDIRGFTAMSEKMPAEAVVEILNRYLTLTANSIHKYRGTLDKFIGDAVMAFWNAPKEQETPVLLACQAAVEMIERSHEFCADIKKEFGASIAIGVGVHWGRAVVGNIGMKSRMDYTAIGDTVNTASRLESNAEGGQILISRAVADALGDYGKTEKLNKDIVLKGKEKGFEILILKSLKRNEQK